MTALSPESRYQTRALAAAITIADELGSVTKACRIMGFHRGTFYEVRCAFQTDGVAAVVESRRGARAPHPNTIRRPATSA